MTTIEELLSAVRAATEDWESAIAIQVADSEAAAAAILVGIQATADAQSAYSAEHPPSGDNGTTTRRKSVSEMYWHEHLAELLNSDAVPPAHVPRLRQIAGQRVPNAGDADYLAGLLRYVRGDATSPPCLVGGGMPGQTWGAVPVMW